MSDTITLPGLPKVRPEEKTRKMPMYNVVLLDDDDHTFEYVIGMLQQLFGYPREKGFQMAIEVDCLKRRRNPRRSICGARRSAVDSIVSASWRYFRE